MKTLLFAGALATVLGTLGSATAQVYPARPLTMISPFPAGAPLDTIARVIGERMRASLGQPVIVENVTGAAGTLGVARAARSAADGYTISVGNFSSHVLIEAVYATQFDVLRDLEPVALLATNPQLIISKNAVPASDLKGLIAWFGQDIGGYGWRRQPIACCRSIFSERDRDALPVRAVSRRQLGATGFDGGTDRPAIRPSAQCATNCARR
jgi:tripartite-type tricarboxylate transporter receptor subunit TctC